jgi:RecA/RadA recombinase
MSSSSSSLLAKMMKTGGIKNSSILSKSSFFNAKAFVKTELPILNIAFSGAIDGGITSGLTVVAGASKSFKTLITLYCMKAYLDKHTDGIAIIYDSEFGITPEYLTSIGIDTERVLHIPIEDIEQLKFDMMEKLQEIDPKERVFIMIDSIGNLASKKEVEDAENGKSVADMTRAKSLKSLFRMITPKLVTRDIPLFAINHIYMEIGLYPKAIVSGGTGIYYSANTVFIISKSQEKDGTELAGFKYTINIEKSRYVKEKSKLPFTVLYDKGIMKWSALLDLAIESGHVVKANQGWYNTVDMSTGEVIEPKRRAKDIESDSAFFEKLIVDAEFQEFIKNRFRLSAPTMTEDTSSNDDEGDYDETEE